MPNYKRLIKKRGPARKIIFSLVICCLMAALIWKGFSLLIHFSDFKIKQVYIINQKGRPVARPQDFFRLDLAGNLNLFTFEMKKAAQDIQARHPEVASVFIRKQFPHTLIILVKEREPLALIVLGKLYLSDKDAFILPFDPLYKDLPKITGINPAQIQPYSKSVSLNLQNALSLLAQLKKAKIYPEYKISRIDTARYQDLAFYLENGIEVKMGQGGLARKTALLKGILTQLKRDKTVPEYIDLRFGNPAVLPRDY